MYAYVQKVLGQLSKKLYAIDFERLSKNIMSLTSKAAISLKFSRDIVDVSKPFMYAKNVKKRKVKKYTKS